MAKYDSGHRNPIEVPRKFVSFSLNTKTQSKQVNNAWIWIIEFWNFKNKPISVLAILDGFDWSKGLDRFSGWQGMYLDTQNHLKQAESMTASCLKVTNFLSLKLGFWSNSSVLSWLICIVYIYWKDLRLNLERINQHWMEIKFDFFMKIKFSKLDQFQSNLAKFDIIL